MNLSRKRTTRRQILKARARLAKLKSGASKIAPPFYHYPETYKQAFTDSVLKFLILKGGRGSAKSFSSCCFLIEESFDNKFSNGVFIFAREIQNSISDSVYAMLKSLIYQAHLQEFFLIQSQKIVNRLTGVQFSFMGLRSTGGATAFSQINRIKGRFAVYYLMCDEAQDLREDTINVLFPTVNRGSKVSIIDKPWHKEIEQAEDALTQSRFIFCMNPNFENDPIVIKVQGLIDAAIEAKIDPPGRIIHLNIFDIEPQYQDAQLLAEAAAEKDEIYYPHVWLGEASHKISGYPWLALEVVRTTEKIECYGCFIDPSFKGGDYTAVSFMGAHRGGLVVWGLAFKQSWNQALMKIVEAIQRHKPDYVWYEDNSLGTVPEDLLAEHKIKAKPHTSLGNKENRIYKVAYYVAHRTRLISNLCNSEYQKQVVQYNEEADNDDAPDSLASVMIKSGVITERMKF